MGEREDAHETFKLRRLDKALKTNYELAFDNLCENLWHQMSFYPATWLAVPYLARLMEKWEKESDAEWMFRGILAVGSCLATDVFGDRPKEDEVWESCENCDEEIEFGYFDPSKRIEKADVPVKKWDGESLADVNSWLFNLFVLLGDTEGVERLCYYFGTYTCPECGKRTNVLTGMIGYFLP